LNRLQLQTKKDLYSQNEIVQLIAVTNNGNGNKDANVHIEAETGLLYGPLVVGNDENASYEKFIYSPTGDSNPTGDPTKGRAEYSFSITEPGNYVIWGRIYAPSGGEDSFFFVVDSDPDTMLWDIQSPYNEWRWMKFTDRDAGEFNQYLNAGQHSLTVIKREINTRIDKIIITKDLTFEPDGKEELPLGDVVSNFESWSGDLTGNENPIEIIMNSNKTLIAHFNIDGDEKKISGNVLYYSNNIPVKDVTLTISGDASFSNVSNSDGFYEFLNLLSGSNYTITPFKQVGSDVEGLVITAYDAALTAMAAVGYHELSYQQRISANVNKDEYIYTYDAALILQYAVGLPKGSNSFVGEWSFIPENKLYEPLVEDYLDQDFEVVLLGDVNGDWNSPIIRKKKNLQREYTHFDKIKVEENKIIIPLFVELEKEILSADIEFLYDDNTIKFEKFERTPFSEKFIISENKERGKIRIGMFTVSPVNKNGNLLNLIFSRKKTNNNKVILNLNKFQLNDDVIMYAKRDVIFEENQAAFKKYILKQNYPNPFNSSTMINYFVGESAFGFLKIFNMFGQEVKTLVEGRISKGIHRVIWDGKNSNACKVSNGVYVYQLCIDGNKINKKLIIME